MKKLFPFVLLFWAVNCYSQNDLSVFINSNLEYAPLGFGFIIHNETDPSIFINAKFSGDYLSRTTSTNDIQEFRSSRIFDVNEVFVTGGLIIDVAESIGLMVGVGIFTGEMFQPHYTNKETWFPVDENVGTHPAFTWGVVLGKGRARFLLGYDAAFVPSESYPTNQLNTNALVRLTSTTIGLAVTL